MCAHVVMYMYIYIYIRVPARHITFMFIIISNEVFTGMQNSDPTMTGPFPKTWDPS